MASEDEYVFKSYTVTNDTIVKPICGANPRRIGIWFSITTAFGSVGVEAKVGGEVSFQVLVPATSGLEVHYRNWGPLPSVAWDASAGAGGQVIFVLEMLQIAR